MPTVLACVALAVNGLGVVYACLARGKDGWRTGRRAVMQPGLRGMWIALGLLLLAAFAATLPTAPPFSPGGALGRGFLFGGVVGMLAVMLAAIPSPAVRFANAVGAMTLAGFGVTLLLYLLWGDPTDGLLGFALGAVAVAVVCCGVLRSTSVAGMSALYRTGELYALTATGLVAAVRLAMDHFPAVRRRPLRGDTGCSRCWRWEPGRWH